MLYPLDALERLDAHATSGVWGQFSTQHGPWKDEAMALWKSGDKNRCNKMDTSHHMSAMTANGPKRLAEFTHADDAAFAEALVNLWRAGKLKYVEDEDV